MLLPLRNLAKLAAFLPLLAAGADDATRKPPDRWAVVHAYIDANDAHRKQQMEIFRAEIGEEEKERRRQELGPAPDETAAVAAATAIIESGGEHTLDAVDFLLNRPMRSISETALATALNALAAHIGPNWSLVEDYRASEGAIMAAFGATRLDDTTEAEKQRLRELIDRGPEPRTVDAVAAALAVVDTGGMRALEAAEFLIEQTTDLRPTGAMVFSRWLRISAQSGEAALIELVGPNWEVIGDYLEQSEAWEIAERDIRDADPDEKEQSIRLGELGDRPTPSRASAAAIAILDLEGDHEKTRRAAEFLLDNPTRGGAVRALKGAQALAAHFPDYDKWPLRLKQVNDISNVHQPAKAFINDLADSLEDPIARATARYFAASHRIQSANLQSLPDAERTAHEEQALALATGLSAGIANEAFILNRQDTDGTERPMTFADAESELLYSLQSTTVGGFVSDVTASRLDGTPDGLSNYAGQVVLVDFWATWCGPCIAAFPKLREMTAELPEEHFQIIGINVDAELETAQGYLDDNPLPWVVWHVGDESEIVRKWRVTGFPTYVLIGPEGRILARNAGTFDEDFRTIIEQAVSELIEPAAATP
ncbi:MAG: TlpA disulfide reductase family protein [Gammaproteobacteria bacterium]|nr:TlpA disulfide reductase family protein [Gammaproteobacteria bacterium]